MKSNHILNYALTINAKQKFSGLNLKKTDNFKALFYLFIYSYLGCFIRFYLILLLPEGRADLSWEPNPPPSFLSLCCLVHQRYVFSLHALTRYVGKFYAILFSFRWSGFSYRVNAVKHTILTAEICSPCNATRTGFGCSRWWITAIERWALAWSHVWFFCFVSANGWHLKIFSERADSISHDGELRFVQGTGWCYGLSEVRMGWVCSEIGEA